MSNNPRACLFVPLLITTHVNSQSVDTTSSLFQVKAGISYISNQTYAGRTDSAKLPVVIPSVSLSAKGFYVKTSGYLNLSKNNNGFDGVSIEPGYEFSKGKWNGSIAYVKNFISDSSNLIIAPIKSSIEFYLENENKFIIPSIGAEYAFSDEGNDFIIYAGLAKLITLTHEDKEPSVSLEPSLSVSGGTQNFYYSFLKNYAGNGKKGKRNLPIAQTAKKKSDQFAALDAEFELPLTLTEGKLEWKTTPAFVSAVNLVDSSIETPQSKSYLYISTELVYS